MTNHFKVSLVKSFLRIAGGIIAITNVGLGSAPAGLILLSTFLVIAEIFGIVEEMVEVKTTPSHW